MRLGPSASEAHRPGEDQLEDFVKSLSHIQHVLGDPSMRSVVGVLAPQLLSMFPVRGGGVCEEVEKARDGAPSGSRPGRVSVGSAVPTHPSVPKEPVKSKPAVKPEVSENRKPAPVKPEVSENRKPDPVKPEVSENRKPAKVTFTPDPKPMADPNSSTHRAAYARLVRKMEKVEVAKFPNVHRLWSGGRKDSLQDLPIQMTFAMFLPSTL